MKLRNPRDVIALVLITIILSSTSADGSRADLSPIKRDFRNLCQTLKMKCARPAPRKKAPVKRATGNKATAVPAESAEKAGSIVPIPRSKPATNNTALTTARTSIAESKEKAKPITPIPRSKPMLDKTASATTTKASVPAQEKLQPKKIPEEVTEKKIASVARPQKDATKIPAPEVVPYTPDNSCLVNLKNSGVEFDRILTNIGDGRCRVDVPVRLSAISTTSGKIALPDSPILSCRFARQFALWLSDTGAVLVSTHLDMTLAKISTGPGYECRGRNGDASTKLSEHAFGNAVDITTITTADGRRIQVSDAGSPGSPSFQVLRGLRTTACGYFSTVLGPGSNTAHDSHFHFDMGMHGRSKNYRICE